MSKIPPPQSPRWSFARDFSLEDGVLAEAWGQVAPAVESLHLCRFEDGGACISVAVNPGDNAESEAVSAWLIWPEAREICAKSVGAAPRQRRHAGLRPALQTVCPLLPAQWRSVELIAQGMLAYRRALYAEQTEQDLSLAA